jgi:hypothetical protein
MMKKLSKPKSTRSAYEFTKFLRIGHLMPNRCFNIFKATGVKVSILIF